MNWLDTQTKEILQKVGDQKLAPPKTAEFALVLVRKGQDHQRLINAIVQINKCSESEATILASRRVPATINPDLTEEEALWGYEEWSLGRHSWMRNDPFGGADTPQEDSGTMLRDFSSYLGESPMFEASGLSSTSLPRFSSLELVSLWNCSCFQLFRVT